MSRPESIPKFLWLLESLLISHPKASNHEYLGSLGNGARKANIDISPKDSYETNNSRKDEDTPRQSCEGALWCSQLLFREFLCR
jgi:hypothetical protein